jgi:hypothetical protein
VGIVRSRPNPKLEGHPLSVDNLPIIKTDNNKCMLKRIYLYTLQIKLQILVLAACSSVVFAASDHCTPSACKLQICKSATEIHCGPNEMVVPNATDCGCCDGCVRLRGMMIITIIMDVFSTKTISLIYLWCCALWLTIVLFYIFIVCFVFTLVLHRNWPF